VEYLFLFSTVKNYKNLPREMRVIVENNVASFFSRHGVVGVSCNVQCYDYAVMLAHHLVFTGTSAGMTPDHMLFM